MRLRDDRRDDSEVEASVFDDSEVDDSFFDDSVLDDSPFEDSPLGRSLAALSGAPSSVDAAERGLRLEVLVVSLRAPVPLEALRPEVARRFAPMAEPLEGHTPWEAYPEAMSMAALM